MAEIEITLPTVQYGNVKVRATPEELGMDLSDAGAIGHGVAIYLNLFSQGFATGSRADVEWSSQEGVSAALSASQGVTEVQAQRMLDEGLGGVTEVPAGDVVAHEGAPWDNPQVDSKPKPWEAGGSAPVTAEW